MGEATEVYVGIDVSKGHLDVGTWPVKKGQRFTNDDEGIKALKRWLNGETVKLVVVEATGGFEALLVGEMHTAKVAIAVVNPRQARNFAQATGQLAKTDQIDAFVLAHFASVIQPRPQEPLDEATQELEALVARRRQLVEMRVAEQNRRSATRIAKVRKNIEQTIEWLNARIKDVDKDLDRSVRQSVAWRSDEDLLRSIPGIGPVVARTLLTGLRELGKINNKAITKLAGLAPMAHDSGTQKGKRRIWGGRGPVRDVLYMAALAAIRHCASFKDLYQRLLAHGKAKKVAIVACMRQLLIVANACMRDRARWNPAKELTA